MKGKLLRVSNVDVSAAAGFIYDGCHKIYVCRTKNQAEICRRAGDRVHPMSALERTFVGSCPLRFINWEDTLKTIVPQCAQRVTFTYSDRKSVVRFRPL